MELAMKERLNRLRKVGSPDADNSQPASRVPSAPEDALRSGNGNSDGLAKPVGMDSPLVTRPEADKLLITALVLGPVSNVTATLRADAEQTAELKRNEVAEVEARTEATRADATRAALRTDANRILNLAFIAPAVVAVVAAVTLMLPDAWRISSTGFFLVGDNLVYDAASMAKGHLPVEIAVLCILMVTCVICRRYWNRDPSELRYLLAGVGVLMVFAIYPMVFLALLLLANALVYVAAAAAAVAIIIFMLNVMLD